jgi:hypothetical protein
MLSTDTSPYPPESFVELVRTGLQQLMRNRPSDLDELLFITRLRFTDGAKQYGAARYGVMKAIEQLELQSPEAAEILRQRYLERKSIQEIVSITHRSSASVHRDLRQATAKLAEILWEFENREYEDYERVQFQRLEPPTYDRLFGVDEIADELFQLLTDPNSPSLIMLVGAGGVGKSSLADFLTRRIIKAHIYEGIGWVSIRPQMSLWDMRPFFTAESTEHALEQVFEQLTVQLLGEEYVPSPFDLAKAIDRLDVHLRRGRHFIVLDNLETLEQPESLFEALRRFTPQTKFLMTSRRLPTHSAEIFEFRIPQLDAEASIALLRHQAQKRNVVSLMEADREVLMQLYEKIGGNPLALKLVVGQASVHALKVVMEDIEMARGRTVQELYEYLYRWAWNNLSEKEQKVFLAMPLLPPEGGQYEQIVAITQMDESDVHDALEKLVTLSLVEFRPGIESGRYAIHGLTRTFLQEQAARWG